jgi:hypothetical protein
VAYAGNLGGESIKSGDEAPRFSDRDVSLIDKSLPATVVSRRRQLLPQILRDWSSNDLHSYMQFQRRASPERREKMERIRDCAHALVQAFDETDEVDRWGLADMMVREAAAQISSAGIAGRAEFIVLNQRITETVDLLNKLRKAADQTWRYDRGGPRNVLALSVLSDIAAIFEWATGKAASRHSPFRRFAAAIWPVVFGSGTDGLHSAMKNWASSRNKSSRTSPLMVNMDERHPEWGVFAPDPMNSPL